MTDPNLPDDVSGYTPDPGDIDPTIRAARYYVGELNNALMKMGDSISASNSDLQQQTHAMEAAIAGIRLSSEKIYNTLETARGKMRQLFVALGMEYEEYFEMNGMDRAVAMAKRKMHDSEFEHDLREAREERKKKRARRSKPED